MPVPKYHELIPSTFEAFHKLGGSASIPELEAEVTQIIGLSEEDISELMPNQNRTKFGYRLAWARNYMKNYGLLENTSRGVWALTPAGQKLKSVDKDEIVRSVRENQKLEKKEAEAESEELETDSEEDSWQEILLDQLKAIQPEQFERLCQRVLRESGFTNVSVLGQSGDGGIDGRGVVQIGGLLSFHVFFQCKRYKDTVSASVIRDFRGAMSGRADKGLIITTGRFTTDAKKEALRDGTIPLDLIDGEQLVQKLKDLRLGVIVTERIVEDVEIKKEWFYSL